MGRWLRFFGWFMMGLVVAVMTAWAALAVFYSNLPGALLRGGVAAGLVLAALMAFAFLPNRRRTLIGYLAGFALLVACWLTIPASNNRAWQPDVAVLPNATVDGTRITLHNIRYLHYRTETDFDARCYDKTFDLQRLDSVDLITVYWMGDVIAHIMVSFGFGGRDFVTFSIETRKEEGEGYSTLKGFFKQYELIYIVGDERDLIRVRTDFRNPPGRRLPLPPEHEPGTGSPAFHVLCRKDQPAVEVPGVVQHRDHQLHHERGVARAGGRRPGPLQLAGAPFRLRPPVRLHAGGFGHAPPFEELRRRSIINPKARAAGEAEDFSLRIRENLPIPEARQ